MIAFTPAITDAKVNFRNGLSPPLRRVHGPRPPSILHKFQHGLNNNRNKTNSSKRRNLLSKFNNYNRQKITIGRNQPALLGPWYQHSIESRLGKRPGRDNKSSSMRSLNERPTRSYSHPNSAIKNASVSSSRRTSGYE